VSTAGGRRFLGAIARFTDVPCEGSPFDPWIEEFAALGVSGGCGASADAIQLAFCPEDPVTREQMAGLLLKTLEGTRGQMAVFLTKAFWLQLYGGR
jgi:hypothetical protein